MSLVAVATVEGSSQLHFLCGDWLPGSGTIFIWTDRIDYAKRFSQVEVALKTAAMSIGRERLVTFSVEDFDKIQKKINAAKSKICHYIIRETTVRDDAENHQDVAFVFATAALAETHMMNRVAWYKKDGFSESFRHQHEHENYIRATHLSKGSTLVKMDIIPYEFVGEPLP